MNTKNQNQVEEIHHRELRWYCLSAIGMATLSRDEDDAKAVAAESDQLYPQNGPHLAVQMAPVSPDGRGTDAQIEKEREIARLAIVGAIAAGHAGRAHPGADHWLAAAHDAGLRIAELEQQARCSRSACLSQSAESDQQQALSITSAQPAEVSDEEINRIVYEHTKLNPNQADDVELLTYIRNAVRAILALRPQAVPMTEQWRLLRSGERIEAGDEGLQDDCETWLPLAGWEVGMTYNPTALVPMRRRVPSITAPAGGEG